MATSSRFYRDHTKIAITIDHEDRELYRSVSTAVGVVCKRVDLCTVAAWRIDALDISQGTLQRILQTESAHVGTHHAFGTYTK